MRVSRPVVAIVVAGTVARLVVALLSDGQPFDMGSFRIVQRDLAAHGIDAYRYVNLGNYHWPYPPGYFPWVALSGALVDAGGHAFTVLIRLPSIAADAALALVVQHYVGLRGASERVRGIAAALIAFGPLVAIVSGYQGQIDAVAILPAAVALLVWERMDGARRALLAGVLIGAGGALKTVPLLMLLPLLPSARSWREAGVLCVSAVAVPLAAIAPFLVAQYDVTEAAIRTYHGYPGQGGVTLVLQPELAKSWLFGNDAQPLHLNALVRRLVDNAQLVNGAIYAAVAAVLFRYRPAPAVGATILWLATYALAPAFFFQYLVWGIPFFVMAGYLRATALLQAAVLVPAVLFYAGTWKADWPPYVFVPIMLATWIGMLLALAALARGLAARRSASDLGSPAAVSL